MQKYFFTYKRKKTTRVTSVQVRLFLHVSLGTNDVACKLPQSTIDDIQERKKLENQHHTQKAKKRQEKILTLITSNYQSA